MSEPTNQEILEEIKKLNEKIDKSNEEAKGAKGLSTPLAVTALFFGYLILGPIVSALIVTLFN